ncbi:unnamed protein product [Didymodactylos carnosus]|uniref:Uncharacterized protein n=1 Tax=Didymodactylos carnosus TaxID=1234261 RepID=A0A815JYB9_9BILA|nr:unnamed protein product [Didymodactylos carnosus]CAF1403731.1 unnamed protein product [Didymodactylos carnosus]CAF4210038.1 unnamed protein product [Didymodactylos carnosus]CAF4279044.1 unnamed protein product [Didymodactylos carnosus]
MYNIFWPGTTNSSSADNGAQILYQWELIPGQVISRSGSPYYAEAQFNTRNWQNTTFDTYFASAIGNGITYTRTGHF